MSGYPEYLKYFMWEWQVYFRISCQTGAESLFNRLDRGLSPNAFLVGFALKENPGKSVVCIEPEELDFSIEEFENLQGDAEIIYKNDPDGNMFYTGEGMQEEMNERMKRKSFKEALENRLNSSENNKGKLHFASDCVTIGDYIIFIVLALDRSSYETHIHLKHKDPENRIKFYYSLLETTVMSYLEAHRYGLFLPEPGKNLSSDFKSSTEILRDAAKNFMYTIAWAGKKRQGLHLLYDACNNISIAQYEGAQNYGHLIIASNAHPDIEMTLEFQAPFSLDNFRKVRKILQLSNAEIGVICNSYEAIGLGKIKTSYNPTMESIFSIKFRGTHCYDVVHNDNILLEMRYSLPELSSEVINQEKFFSDAKRIFTDITNNQVDTLYEIAIIAAKQSGGSMFVFINDAHHEAERLSKQCINIKPIKLNEALVKSLTMIDGALIIDLDGFVHAKGVILDGIIGYSGDSSRGSRYNSALTYQEYRGFDNPTMIVVVSDDGMVDVIPNLVPVVKHSEIVGFINILEDLKSPAKFNTKAFYNSMEWLKNRQFYLTKEECIRINDLKSELQELDRKSGDRTMWIMHEDLLPHPLMNNSYYSHEIFDENRRD